MEVSDNYDYSSSLLLMEPFENPVRGESFMPDLPEFYGTLWEFKKNVAAWTFGINKYKDYVYLLYQAKDQSSFLPMKLNEKVALIELHHTDYIVIVLREVAADGKPGDHVHSLVLDINADHAKFDMEALTSFLEESQLNELVKTFRDAKYIPWIDSTAFVTCRRMNNIWGALDRHAIRHVQKAPAIGEQPNQRKGKQVDQEQTRSAGPASGSAGAGQGQVRSQPRKRPEAQSEDAENAKRKRAKTTTAQRTVAAGSSGSALTTVGTASASTEKEKKDFEKFSEIQKNFWNVHKSCFVLGEDPFEVSIKQCFQAKDEYIIRKLERGIVEDVKKALIQLGDIKQRQRLCVTPVDKKKRLLKTPPKKWDDIKNGGFMIINGQHSIAASQELQTEDCGETRRLELQKWEAYVVWSLDAEMLTNISAFYNSTNHLDHAQPTWGNQIISCRNIWLHLQRPTNDPEEANNRRNLAVFNTNQYLKFTKLIVSRFQNINPEKEGATVKSVADLKCELKIITLSDHYFKYWSEFLTAHSAGELVEPMTGMKFKALKGFNKKAFSLKREFFKHLGHFTDLDLAIYAMHLLNKSPGRKCSYPKVSVQKTKILVPGNQVGADWVERRKRKKVVLDELMNIKPNLQLRTEDGDVFDNVWKSWKRRHRFSSSTWDFLLSTPRPDFFKKRLTNEAKNKTLKDIGDKFEDERALFQRFMKLKYRLPAHSGGVQMRGLDPKQRVLVLSENYEYVPRPLNLAILDIRHLWKPEEADDGALLQPFLEFLVAKVQPTPTDVSVWLWILGGPKESKVATRYAATHFRQFECVQSTYIPSRAERLNNVTNRSTAPPVTLLFFFKKGDEHSKVVRQWLRPEYRSPDIPYYLDGSKNNEAKWRLYATELRMEFYLEILQCFARPGENVLGIYVGTKCVLVAKMFGAYFYGLVDKDLTKEYQEYAAFADHLDMNDFLHSNSPYSAKYVRPLYVGSPLLLSVSPPSDKDLHSPADLDDYSPGEIATALAAEAAAEIAAQAAAEVFAQAAAEVAAEAAEGDEEVPIPRPSNDRSVEAIRQFNQYGTNIPEIRNWEIVPHEARQPAGPATEGRNPTDEEEETDTEFEEQRAQQEQGDAAAPRSSPPASGAPESDSPGSESPPSGGEGDVPAEPQKLTNVITHEYINCSDVDSDTLPHSSDGDDEDSENEKESQVPPPEPSKSTAAPSDSTAGPSTTVKVETGYWEMVAERKARREARKKVRQDELAQKDKQINEAIAASQETQKMCARLGQMVALLYAKASSGSPPRAGAPPIPSIELILAAPDLQAILHPRVEDPVQQVRPAGDEIVATTPVSQLPLPSGADEAKAPAPATVSAPVDPVPPSVQEVEQYPRLEDISGGEALPSSDAPSTLAEEGEQAIVPSADVAPCTTSQQIGEDVVPQEIVDEQLVDYEDELLDIVPEEGEMSPVREGGAGADDVVEGEASEPQLLRSLHRPMALKALPDGNTQSISGILCSFPLSSSPDSAFKQVGSQDATETVKRQRVTRSLLSGSEKSLSMSSESASGSTKPSLFSGPYMMRTAEDAASATIDFSKGDVEDGVMDSPPSRGPIRTPVYSPSPLKRASSSRGCPFSPMSRNDANTSRKLVLSGSDGAGDGRLEDDVLKDPTVTHVSAEVVSAAVGLPNQCEGGQREARSKVQYPRLEDNEPQSPGTIRGRRSPSPNTLFRRRILRDHRPSMSSKPLGSTRPYINNVNMPLPRPPSRGTMSMTSFEIPQRAREGKRKKSGSRSSGLNTVVQCVSAPHYPSRREDIYRGLARLKALEEAKSNSTGHK